MVGREVELHGGPLDGRRIPIEDPLGMECEPDRIGLPIEAGSEERAWYLRGDDGEYRFDTTQDGKA
jgi:hypothetical protein